jgi:VWFA-related protein
MRGKHRIAAVMAAFVGLAALPHVASAQEKGQEIGPESVISVDVEVVNILATVREKNGGLISDLAKNDFDLEIDGKPQEIRYFARQTDLPLTIGLLVDTSVSQQNIIDIERSASYQFFNSILRNKKDLAFLISFDINSELLQDLTDSSKLLAKGLEALEVQGGGGGIHPGPVPTSGRSPGTVLFDAVYLACNEMLRPQVGRKAIVIISDGNDWGSKLDLKDAIEAAHRSDVVIYAIRYFDQRFYYQSGALGGGGGAGTLKKLSRETGGNMFEVSRKRPLNEIFDQIQAEMRNQYSIGFTPSHQPGDRDFHKIELKTKSKRHEVQARSGYYANSLGR